MPELPDVEVYVAALAQRIAGQPLQRISIRSTFLVRSIDPPVFDAEGQTVVGIRRLGKRIVWALAPSAADTPSADEPLFLVFHLMIAGRFRWSDKADARPPGKIGLAAFGFPHGAVLLTEASQKKRASLHAVRGEAALATHSRGGAEPLALDADEFTSLLRRENHTIKRTLTDPRILSGIGNAYSDEILVEAGISPIKWTTRLTDDECRSLFDAMQAVLTRWTARLRKQFAKRFPGPGDITAFRPDFNVHGKFGEPCGICGAKVQRIQYAENETNYCPRCQTDGKILADRSLSRLLKSDWPRTLEALEEDQGADT